MLLASLEPLAPVWDLADRTGSEIALDDVQALRLLADASALFRSLSGQQINLIEDDEQELAGTWERTLRLPQLPVVSLASAAMRCPGELIFTTLGDTTPPTRRGKVYRAGGWGGPDAAVRVVYSHGTLDIPDDVRGCVCSMAERGLSLANLVEANPTGVTQWTAGPVSVSYESPASASASVLGLTAAESDVIAKYRAWG